MKTLLELEQERLSVNPFISYNHIKVKDVQPDYSELYLDIVPESHNQQGILHGAVYFALADCCGGVAARTNGHKYVTQNAQVNFLKPAKEGRIYARSHIIHRGRSGCLVDVNIFDEQKTLLFSARLYYFCLE